VSQITVYHNGKISTNAVPSLDEAMVVEDGKILAVGSSFDLLQRHAKDAKLVDLGGRTVIPGLND